MALTDAQTLRLKIQDIPAIADTVYAGDGSAAVFNFPHRNLTSASAFVAAAGGWSATGCAFDASGYVAFSGVISANTAWRARYVYSVFSDDELAEWLSRGGSVNAAAIEAVTSLMFDGTRRARWSAPDGTSYSDTEAIALLKSLYDALSKEGEEEATVGGDIGSWSLNQELY